MMSKFLSGIQAGVMLGIRAPLRSRLVATLLFLLAVTIIVLPQNLVTDGTDAGLLRMLLTWTLGSAVTLLSIATLWAGCAVISGDIEEKRYVLTATSPARPFCVFLGRWLGLVVLNALLLTAVLGSVYVQVRLRGLGPEQTSVLRLLPQDPLCLKEEADRLYATIFPSQQPDSPEAVRAAILRDLKGPLHLPLEPGMERCWRFFLPDPSASPEQPIRGKLRYLTAYGSTQTVNAVLECFDPDGNRIFSQPLDDHRGLLVFEIPPSLRNGLPALTVVLRNSEPSQSGNTLLIRHNDALQLFLPYGGLARNLFFGGIACLALLALLAAVGIACGCCLSFPVAAFAASALCLIALVAGNPDFSNPDEAAHSHGTSTASMLTEHLESLSRSVSAGTNSILSPMRKLQVFDRLGDGIALEPQDVLCSFAITGLLYPVLLALLSSVPLRRREL